MPRGMRFGLCTDQNLLFTTLVERWQYFERLGYDSLWLLDSQLVGREVYATMATCALATERIMVGSGVIQPYTRHATVDACAHATLDELTPEHCRMFMDELKRPSFVLLGTGREHHMPPPPVAKLFAEAGIGLEPMSTGAAARTYNVLLAEGRDFGAGLIAVD